MVAENLVDHDPLYLPAGQSPTNLLLLCFEALEIAVPEIFLNVIPGNGQTVEFLTMEVRALRGRFLQKDEKVNGLGLQMHKLEEQFQKAKSLNHAQHQRLQLTTMKR